MARPCRFHRTVDERDGPAPVRSDAGGAGASHTGRGTQHRNLFTRPLQRSDGTALGVVVSCYRPVDHMPLVVHLVHFQRSPLRPYGLDPSFPGNEAKPGHHRSTRTGCTFPFGKWAARSRIVPAAELRQAQVIVSAPTRAAHTLGKVLPWEVLRLRAYTGGTRTDSTSTRPTVNNAVPVQHGCGRSLRPAFAWSPPRKSPTAPAPSTAGDTTSRPTANAMRLTPPLVRMVLVRYAAPAPGDSGGLFSSRACLVSPLCTGLRGRL